MQTTENTTTPTNFKIAASPLTEAEAALLAQLRKTSTDRVSTKRVALYLAERAGSPYKSKRFFRTAGASLKRLWNKGYLTIYDYCPYEGSPKYMLVDDFFLELPQD